MRREAELFEEAQRIVRWHYQWIVVHEFLPKVVGEAMADDVISSPRRLAPAVHRKFFEWEREPFIPVEFSGAAYRFGHSMVRAGVRHQADVAEGGPTPATAMLPLFPDLAGFRPAERGRSSSTGSGSSPLEGAPSLPGEPQDRHVDRKPALRAAG